MDDEAWFDVTSCRVTGGIDVGVFERGAFPIAVSSVGEDGDGTVGSGSFRNSSRMRKISSSLNTPAGLHATGRGSTDLDGMMRTVRHTGHLVFLPALSSSTRNGARHPEQEKRIVMINLQNNHKKIAFNEKTRFPARNGERSVSTTFLIRLTVGGAMKSSASPLQEGLAVISDEFRRRVKCQSFFDGLRASSQSVQVRK